MMCAEGMLCSYASAIEMAFAANLLVTALASVYNFLGDRFKDLSNATDGFTKDPYIQEELGIELLGKILKVSNFLRYFFWWTGLSVVAISAPYLYHLAWHVSPDTMVGDGWQWGFLMFAAYAGPTFMILMTAVGFLCANWADYWENKLEEKAETKKQTFNQLAAKLKARDR